MTDLDTLEALASAATEGPWEAEVGVSIEVNAGTARTKWNDTRTVGIPARSWRTTDRILEVDDAEFDLDDAEYDQIAANAEFISAAREAVPALIARVRELEAQRDAVLALHAPLDVLNTRYVKVQKVCAGCGADDGNWNMWPCATVRALTMDGTPSDTERNEQ